MAPLRRLSAPTGDDAFFVGVAAHDEAQCGPLRSRAPGTPDSVNVVFSATGNVVIDDVVDVLHVNAPTGQVRRDHDRAATAPEILERSLPLCLAPAAVQTDGTDPFFLQEPRDPFGPRLRASENEHFSTAGIELGQQARVLFRRLQMNDVFANARRRFGDVVDAATNRLDDDAIHHANDFRR